MKISYASIMMLLSMTALAIPDREAYNQDRSAHALNILEARKGCSGQRQASDLCSGRRLTKMDSFHGWLDINRPLMTLYETNFYIARERRANAARKTRMEPVH